MARTLYLFVYEVIDLDEVNSKIGYKRMNLCRMDLCCVCDWIYERIHTFELTCKEPIVQPLEVKVFLVGG